MAEKKQKRKFVQLSSSEMLNTDGWLVDGKTKVTFGELTDKQLKVAIQQAEAKELKFHNLSSFFNILTENLIKEAEKRNLPFEHYNTEFTEQTHNHEAKS